MSINLAEDRWGHVWPAGTTSTELLAVNAPAGSAATLWHGQEQSLDRQLPRSGRGHASSQRASIGDAAPCPVADAINSPVLLAVQRLFSLPVKVIRFEEVVDYLSTHSDLLGPLAIACLLAASAFRGRGELCLQVNRDPEFDDPYLVLEVRLNEYPKGILREIEDLQRRVEPLLARRSGDLLITTDFSRP